MDLNKILAEYDEMFGKVPLDKIEEYLYNKICEAIQKGEDGAILTLMNEMIGLCRDTSQKEKALVYCEQVKRLLTEMKLEGTESYATSMQNIANAYRAFGKWQEAEGAFLLIEKTYTSLGTADLLWASLYNNWGLLYQEQGNYSEAVRVLKKALEIISRQPDSEIKQAITKTNLSNSLLAAGEKGFMVEGVTHLKEALEIFQKDGERDFHYGAALVAMGDYCAAQKELHTAKRYYRKGLVEILKHTGKTDSYDRVLEKYHAVSPKTSWVSNLQKCREFYEKYGKRMIHENFPAYENRIAVGMAGEGSDCFGFDDEISTDHDYGLGFCMWLTDEDYEKIGEELQRTYEKLLLTHGLFGANDRFLKNRRGVHRIDDFYQKTSDEAKICEQVNGEIFRDDLGNFTAKRELLLLYYPESVRRKKLATLLHEFAQYGQSNYARMMARGDYLTASLCISKTIESAMELAYVLNKRYAPYYKWKKKGLEKLEVLPELVWVLEELAELPCQRAAWENVTYDSTALNPEDKCVILIELAAKLLLQELNKQKLVKGEDAFLELYIGQLLEGEKDMIDKVVELEWKQFDRVENEGGRASCQNDFETFSIMRKSQYLTWDEDLLVSYYEDLVQAEKTGWNLITEKYARMMKSTDPARYAELEKDLPVRSADREEIMEAIIRIQVSWMEDFAAKYPKMAGNARSIHTYEDQVYDTSYETYLRGELGTYSEQTFVLYSRFILGLLQEGKNLAYETMRNTALFYGYDSLEKAEERA